jgi:hypothetical protein
MRSSYFFRENFQVWFVRRNSSASLKPASAKMRDECQPPNPRRRRIRAFEYHGCRSEPFLNEGQDNSEDSHRGKDDLKADTNWRGVTEVATRE